MSAHEHRCDAPPGRQVCALEAAGIGERGRLVLLLLSLPILLFLTQLAVQLQPLSRHMTEHIAIMNVAAPVLALAIHRRGRQMATDGRSLLLATCAQLTALFGWHVPAALSAVHASSALHIVMQVTLLAAALWFWTMIVAQVRASRWRAIVALLITGKLVCMLGAVLTFAPRPLYAFGPGHPAAHVAETLTDQQLAGLLMLAACPLTYVLAGVVIAARWLRELQGEER